MARNTDILLNAAQRANIGTRGRQLNGVNEGERITVEYVKRNKENGLDVPAILEGEYVEHTFNSDHGVVKVLTDEGYRSANLHTITRITR